MSREYAEITSVIGMRLKDRLRAFEWEPIPERLADLLAKLQEQGQEKTPAHSRSAHEVAS